MHRHCTLISRGVNTTTKSKEKYDHGENNIREEHFDRVRSTARVRESWRVKENTLLIKMLANAVNTKKPPKVLFSII